MSALSPREAERLAKFIDALLARPNHVAIARACLASRVRWETGDLAFLRVMAVWSEAEPHEMARLLQLVEIGREQVR